MSNSTTQRSSHGALFTQLCWFIQLRWVAGVAVATGALIDLTSTHWFENARLIACVGLIILGYNVVLRLVLDRVERSPQRRRLELLAAWAQLLPDLACLSLL